MLKTLTAADAGGNSVTMLGNKFQMPAKVVNVTAVYGDPHTHSFTYSASGKALTAACTEGEAKAPKNAGRYIAKATVDTGKTATIDFTIAKATPHIVEMPAPTDITYGKTLADSTLVGGLFEWAGGTIKPAVSDSDTTE